MARSRTSPGIEPPRPAVPVTGVPAGPGFIEPDVHVLDRLHVLYKYRKAMVTVVLLVLVAGIVQTYTTTPAYRSETLVRAEPDMPTIGATAAAQQMLSYTDPETFMQTELSVLQSRDLKLKVVRRLRLDKDPEFLAPGGPQGLDGLLSAVRGRVMQPLQSLLSSPAPPQPAQPAAPPAAKPLIVNPETPDETAAVGVLGGGLEITPQQAAHIFRISYSSSKPPMAARIANTLAQEYVDQNLEQKQARINEQLKTISDYLADTTAQIQADQKNLIETTSGANVLDADVVSKNVATAQAELTSRTLARQEAGVKMNDLEKLDPDKDLTGALAHPEIMRAVQGTRQQLDGQNRDRARLLGQNLGANHALVKAVDVQIEQLNRDLKTQIQTQIAAARSTYQTALAQEQLAERSYRAQSNLQVENSKNGIPYQALRDRIRTQQTSAGELQSQQKQLEILAKGVDNNVSIAETAPTPQRPYKPDASRNILISLAVGLALAVMLAFGLDYLDDTIKTPEDVTRKLHIPFLGLVPAVRGDRPPVLSGPVPHDFGEAYRALRTSLVFTSGGESTRTIATTSAQPLEGKTTTACNLAMVLAFGGSRVLLIDADMRRPGVHKTLKINNTVGLSHLLVGQARVREAIQRTSDPNFCVMTAGRTPPNPSELLASERMKQLIANLKQGPFDWVVVDTPPVLAVTDAVILTPLVDAVVFVLGAEMTRRRLAERAVQMLMASRPRVIGGVLNRVNFDRNKYYYSRYYGYQYKSYYGTDPAGATTGKG